MPGAVIVSDSLGNMKLASPGNIVLNPGTLQRLYITSDTQINGTSILNGDVLINPSTFVNISGDTKMHRLVASAINATSIRVRSSSVNDTAFVVENGYASFSIFADENNAILVKIGEEKLLSFGYNGDLNILGALQSSKNSSFIQYDLFFLLFFHSDLHRHLLFLMLIVMVRV